MEGGALLWTSGVAAGCILSAGAVQTLAAAQWQGGGLQAAWGQP